MNTFTLPDKVYDFVKKLLTLVLPALTVLLTTLGTIYGWDVGQIVQTIGAVARSLALSLESRMCPFRGLVAGSTATFRLLVTRMTMVVKFALL